MDLVNIGFKAQTGDMDKADKKLNALAVTGGKVDRANAKMTSSFAMLAATVGTVVAAYQSLSKVVSVSREFDILNAQLITATGSAADAAIAFDAIQQFSATTPYDLAQATKAFNQLVNLGLTPSEAALESYGNTASAMGKDLSQMVEAVADATTGEFERLKEFGIKAKSEGNNVSFTFRGVTKTIGKNAAEIESYLMGLGQNEFAGAMEERAKTLDGSISNLADSWDSLFLTISKAGIGDLMKESVISGTEAITEFDDFIASGALSKSFDAITGKFDLIIEDVTGGLKYIDAVFGISSSSWSDDVSAFYNSFVTTLEQLPEQTRYYIKMTGARIGELVQYVKIYGGAFVDVMKLKFDELVLEAQAAGIKIASMINPLADSIDYSSSRKVISDEIAEREKLLNISIQGRIDNIKSIRQSTMESIDSYASERDAAIDRYEAEMAEADKLLAVYKEAKKAREGVSVLGQFKIEGDSDEGVVDTSYQKWIDGIINASKDGQLAVIASEIEKVKAAMKNGLDNNAALEYLDELEKKANDLKGVLSGADIFNGIANGAKEGLASIQSLSEQGSDEYAKLGVAIQAVTALQAVQAVVNQAAGTNPYESFAKMAAMASAIGALGVSVGNVTGGGFSDSTANNQGAQGLNIWGEKSTSIANGIESIQDSSSDLVIINSGMLTALESLSAGISAASAQSLQGYKAQTLDVSSSLYNNKIEDFINQSIVMSLTGGISSFMPFITSGLADLISPFTSVISGFLGGSSKNTDSGFRISGGSLGDLSDSANVDAFSETQYRTWRYGSTRTRTAYQDLDEASIQFALVFDSLATSVYEGAISLGMSAADAEQAINDYYIATTKISLKGLSAEEQAAEIESVFSSIFDGVSGAVIPYLGEFQQVGEGLGDTLSRLSTEVALTETYADILGFTLSDKLADPYMFATISDNLSTLSGGLEGFSANLSSFVDSFASDDIKLSIATETMQNALSELGLSLPSTTDGFYQLMQGLDATTEAGQAQIAGLLSLTDTAENYYSLLDNTLGSFNDSLESVSDSLMSAIDTIYGVTYEQATTSLDEALMLARAGSYDAALGLDLTSIAPTESNFSNATEFKLEQAKTSNKLSELADLTGTTKTTAEYQLSESINQTALLTELKEQQAKTDAKLDAVIDASSESASALLNFELDAMNVRIVA